MADAEDIKPPPPASGAGWSLGGMLTGFADAIGGGASNGFGLGDAGSGMAGGAAEITRDLRPSMPKMYQGAADAMLGQYPGYGSFWAYSVADGVQVLPLGWLSIAGAAVALWMVAR